MSDELLTAREVAGKLGVSAETVLRWARARQAPGGAAAGHETRPAAVPARRDRGVDRRARDGRGRPRSANHPERPRPRWSLRLPATLPGVNHPPARTRGDNREGTYRCHPLTPGTCTSSPTARSACSTAYADGTRKRRSGFPQQDRRPPLARRQRAAGRQRRGRPVEPRPSSRSPSSSTSTSSGTRRSARRARSDRARTDAPAARRSTATTRLAELETMALELAGWRATLPPRYAPKVMGALRQVLAAGVRWRLLDTNPAVDAGPNPEADPAPVRVYTVAELDAIADELAPRVPAAARVRRRDRTPARGMGGARAPPRRPRPPARARRAEERRRDDRSGRQDEEQRPRGPAHRRARSPRSSSCRRGSTRRCCSPRRRAGRSTSTTSAGANGRPRSRPPASRRPRRPYDLRDTFASNALAAGVTVFELARVMGTRCG